MTAFLRIHLLLFFILLSIGASAQVGIQTDNPKATLDVVAKDPANPTATDGVLIPRVSKLSFAPTAAQNGLLVYLTEPFTAAPVNGGGKYSVGLHQWNSTIRDWRIGAPPARRTTSIDGWGKPNQSGISSLSETTVGCLSVRLTPNATAGRLNVQFRSNCLGQTEAHYTFVQGYGSNDKNLLRRRFGFGGTDWENPVFSIGFDNEEMISGHIYFSNSNKIYNLVISSKNKDNSTDSKTAKVILSIEEL